MSDEQIADRVRRLDRARRGVADDDPEAREVWQNIRTEYWSAGDGLDWLLDSGHPPQVDPDNDT